MTQERTPSSAAGDTTLGVELVPQRERRVDFYVVTAADGRQRDQLCLPLDLLPGWLSGVSLGRARPELTEKLQRYRADCFRVLWQAFAGEVSGIAGATRAVVPVPSAEAAALEHIAQMAEAIAIMAASSSPSSGTSIRVSPPSTRTWSRSPLERRPSALGKPTRLSRG